MNNMIKLNFLLGIIILLSINVYAFGVSTSYWPENPLVLEPGESRDVYFTLQNGAGATEDVIAKVELINGKDITQLLDKDDSYLVPAGGSVRVNLRVTIPDNAKVGDTYTVGISATSTPSKVRGPVLFGSGVDATFPILIQKHEPVPITPTAEAVKEVKKEYNLLSLVGMLLVIAIVIFIFYKLHYKKSGTDTKKRGKKRS